MAALLRVAGKMGRSGACESARRTLQGLGDDWDCETARLRVWLLGWSISSGRALWAGLVGWALVGLCCIREAALTTGSCEDANWAAAGCHEAVLMLGATRPC